MRSTQATPTPPAGAGTEFIAWLAAARRALVVGTENFIGARGQRLNVAAAAGTEAAFRKGQPAHWPTSR